MCDGLSLNGCVTLDEKGFIKTGPDLTQKDLAAAEWPLERSPYLLETSRPGVFAVGATCRAANDEHLSVGGEQIQIVADDRTRLAIGQLVRHTSFP